MYAIVDIETTGGYAASNDITEIAIIIHNGSEVIDKFETLIRPVRPIPYFIQVLTGISHEMVEGAPKFEEVAGRIHEMIQNRIFIAHNVNFDYSFLKHHLEQAGYELNCPRLCTVRLSKKALPGMRSYSLGNLCRDLNIVIENRHRAGGDANATVKLFEHILQNNGAAHIEQSLKRNSREHCLPINLPKEYIDALPYTPGVYYFHNEKGKVIYVGKAKNLKYRVVSHFTHNGAGRQRQEFLRNIYSISYQVCSTELMAFILENVEIRRLWPVYNNSQKRFTPKFALYCFEDMNGYLRLAIDKQKTQLQPLYTFNLLLEGHRLLNRLIKEFSLCPKLCFMQSDFQPCLGKLDHSCSGACEMEEASASYNIRVRKAIDHLDHMLPSFAVVDE
jgi:DNA polymerase-3 subunit epsilon